MQLAATYRRYYVLVLREHMCGTGDFEHQNMHACVIHYAV